MKKIKYAIIPVITLLVGFSLFCFLYPFISNLINEQFNESKINSYNENTDTISSAQIERIFHEAEEYNRLLATDFYDKSNENVNEYNRIINSYFDILDIESGIMGYIEIPAINVHLPIYHGESESVLTKGAAHLERTSFPIGGSSTHACISAHSGFPTQKFFDKIDELKVGDTVTVKVLNRTLNYTVYGSDVVEPDDADQLRVVQGEDILTLVTCYPYGINSHRLLVHARRSDAPNSDATTDNGASSKEPIISETSSSESSVLLFGSVAAVTAILSVAGVAVLKHKKNTRR